MISGKTPSFLFFDRCPGNVCLDHFQPLPRASASDGLLFTPIISDILKNKLSPSPHHHHHHTHRHDACECYAEWRETCRLV